MVNDNDNYHGELKRKEKSAGDHIIKERGERSIVAAYHANSINKQQESTRLSITRKRRREGYCLILCCEETLTKMNLGRKGSIWLHFTVIIHHYLKAGNDLKAGT